MRYDWQGSDHQPRTANRTICRLLDAQLLQVLLPAQQLYFDFSFRILSQLFPALLTQRLFVGMIQPVVAYPLVTFLWDVPEDATHELVMMQDTGLFSLIPMIGVAKNDALIGIKLDLLVVEGAAFDISGQVGDDPFSMWIGFTKMGAPFDPGGHLFYQPLEVFLLQSGW